MNVVSSAVFVFVYYFGVAGNSYASYTDVGLRPFDHRTLGLKESCTAVMRNCCPSARTNTVPNGLMS